jgi:hypothetical protein
LAHARGVRIGKHFHFAGPIEAHDEERRPADVSSLDDLAAESQRGVPVGEGERLGADEKIDGVPDSIRRSRPPPRRRRSAAGPGSALPRFRSTYWSGR